MAKNAFRDRMLAATRVLRGEELGLQKRIGAIYEDSAKELAGVIRKYGSDSLAGRRSSALIGGMKEFNHQLWQRIGGEAESAARKGASIAVGAQTSMLDDLVRGIGYTSKPSFASMFGRTADEAVASVLNGSIYAGKNAALSKRIWNNEAIASGKMEQLIASAVAQGRSATQLAKDLEAYVNPKAMMPDIWNDIYPLPFQYNVDYNAKRLAVTVMNHAYYQGMVMAARDNPFAEFLHWELSSMHLIYDVCDTYMEHDEGLGLGNFSLDNVPLPHPFCRCLHYVDSSKSLTEIGQEIGGWLSGEENARLDAAFAEWDGKDSGVVNSGESGIINLPNISVRHGVGARNTNDFSIIGPDGDESVHLIPGEYIRNVKVFAGKGTSTRIREAQSLAEYYGVPAEEWQKVKGIAQVEYDGFSHQAELHWYQADGIGRIEGKVKRQPDGRWWLDDR